MAHRRIAETRVDRVQRASLCKNAHPYDSEMCQGYSFGDYYKTTDPDPCKELCYNETLTCGSQYGTQEQCMTICSSFSEGVRQATSGNSAQCRLTWAQYAFFVESVDPLRNLLCEFAAIDSAVCRDPGDSGAGKGATLPKSIQEAIMHH